MFCLRLPIADEEHMLSVQRTKEWQKNCFLGILNLFQHFGEEKKHVTIHGCYEYSNRSLRLHLLRKEGLFKKLEFYLDNLR